jgi:polar amino acid transport system substrate-binding protein
VIRVEDVHKHFKSHVLRGVSLHVPASCIYALIGPGASGKSVLLKAIAGLISPEVDLRADRVQRALVGGAETGATGTDSTVAANIIAWSRRRGADAVIITAGGADSGPLRLAAAAARDRARVIVVGTPKLDVPREEFYRKELTLVVSRSYGPGRYDAEFEQKGYVYPEGYVPWTERRNIEEFLDLLAARRIRLDDLGAERVPLAEAPGAYARLAAADGSGPIAVVIDYEGSERGDGPGTDAPSAVPPLAYHHEPKTIPPPGVHTPRSPVVALIGAGSFQA